MKIVEQYELRELYFHSAMRAKETESQFHISRYEKEKRNAETEAHKARNLQNQVHTFHKTETDLRQQLNVYIDKFKQVSTRRSRWGATEVTLPWFDGSG